MSRSVSEKQNDILKQESKVHKNLSEVATQKEHKTLVFKTDYRLM